MATTIESLEVEVKSSSASAQSGLDSLSKALERLKTATSGGKSGLSQTASQINKLNTILNSVNSASVSKISQLASALNKLRNIGNFKLSPTIANNIKKIGDAANSLSTANFDNIGKLATALTPLSAIKGSGLSSVLTQLKKLPEIATGLNSVNWSTLTSQLQQLSNSLAPLSTQIDKVGTAFARMPSNLNRVVTATNTAVRTNQNAGRSYINLYAKLKMAIAGVRGIASTLGGFINSSNEYIEDLNLFNASMGEYAKEAQNYAEKVGDVMGIDPADWMRNQGVFNTIVNGFGVASDKAALMSKNLTQLGYDISSFYNISVEDAMQKLQSGIAGELEPLRRLGYDLSVARLQEEALALGIKEKVSSMTQAEKSQLRYYAIMTQVTKAQGDMARTLNAPANQLRVLKAQLEQCARAIGDIFIPALNAILPYAIAVAKVLRLIASTIANFFGFKLPEVDYSGLQAAQTATQGIADSSDDAAKGFGKAAKAAKKLKNATLGIDELNIISPDDNSDNGSGSGGSSGGGGGGGDLGIDLPQYDFLGDLVSSKVDSIVKAIKDALWEIEAICSGALLAVGAVLVFTGANIPLGLALMAIGAAGLATAVIVKWDTMTERLRDTLEIVTAACGGFLLAIGAVLAFSGANVPLGIAMMAIGATSLVTAIALNWNDMSADIKDALAIIDAIAGGALLALGLMFTLTGVNVPLGVALMIAGATELATAVALNWDKMPTELKQVISTIEKLVGGALLAIGAVFTFTGVDIPLGIALMAAGAISVVSAAVLDWDSLPYNIKTVVAAIEGIVSGALLAVGALFAFTGADIPMGIAMMVAGAVGLVTSIALNWDGLPNKARTVISEINGIVGGALLTLGFLLAASGANIPLGIALMATGAVGIVSAIALNWNSLKGKVSTAVATIEGIVGGALLCLGVLLVFSAGNIPLGIAMIVAGVASIGMSAATLNWDKVSNKVKSVVSKIEAIAGAAALALGIILVCTGVGIPMGIALIISGAASLATAVAVNWGSISSKIKEVLSKIGQIAQSVGMIALGSILCLSGAGIPIGIAMIKEGFSSVVHGESPNWGAIGDKIKQALNDIKDFASKSAMLALGVILCLSGIGIPVGIAMISESISSFKSGKSADWSSIPGKVKEVIGDINDTIKNNPISKFVIGLAKDGWDTVSGWVKSAANWGENAINKAVSLIKEGWQSVSEWVQNVRNWGDSVKKKIDLARTSTWQTVSGWVQNAQNWGNSVKKKIDLIRTSAWTTVSGWVQNAQNWGDSVKKKIDLARTSAWQTVSGWVKNAQNWGNDVIKKIGLARTSAWNTVSGWVKNAQNWGSSIAKKIGLDKNGWTSVASWVKDRMGGAVSVGIELVKNGWTSVAGWVKNHIGGAVSVGVKLVKDGWSSIKSFFGLSSGGIVGANGGVKLFANGGIIPQYARGASPTHGSMFVAGENGSELVGHINGQTEVMNRFQLASVMQSSIVKGMSLYTPIWSAMLTQITECANAIIRATVVSGADVSTQLAYSEANQTEVQTSMARQMNEDSSLTAKRTESDFDMKSFYETYVSPTLLQIANDTRRQADKAEQTIVQIGNRTISEAVVEQRNADGYSFTS